MTVGRSGLGSLGAAVGAGFTGLCCLGAPAALGIVSAAGLGFLINDAILLPLLALFLAGTLWALRRVREAHGRAWPARVGQIFAAALVLGVALGWSAVGYLGVLGLIAATLWNTALAMRPRAVPGRVVRDAS